MSIIYQESLISSNAGASGVLICDKTPQVGITTVAKLTANTVNRRLRLTEHTGVGNIDIRVPVSGLYLVEATCVIAAAGAAANWQLGFGAGTTFTSYVSGSKNAATEFSLQYSTLLELDDGVTYSFLATCSASSDIASGRLRVVQFPIF